MTTLTIPTWTAGVRKVVLDNGLTLLVQRDTSAPVAAVVTHVKAGFFDEPDRWIGISHVFEHMFFKGTPTRGVGQIARETKAAGGYLNASTSYDHTTYYAVLPASRIADAVAIQADALMHAAVDREELARELRVIIQEAKRKLDTPSALTHETLHELMYDHHRIRRWRIGYEQDLAGFTREDVYGYYHSRYVPERTIIAIVGDVDEEEMLALARRTYDGWEPRPGAVDPSPSEPDRREVRTRTLRGDVTQSDLILGWRGTPALHDDAIPLDLAAGVLGAGRGSWLYRALRETGLASSVSAHHYSPTELGVFSIDAECEPERVPEVVRAIAESVARMAMAGVPAADLERARTLLLTRWSRRMEEMDGRAASLASAEALGDYHELDREFALLAATTGEQVRAVARRYLDPEAVSAVLYQPRGRGADLTVPDLAGAFAVTRLTDAGTPVVPEPETTDPPPSTGRAMAGPPVAQVYHAATPAFDLLVRRKSGVPAVTLGVYLPRTTLEGVDRSGITALAVRSAIRGAAGYDAAALAFGFERLGGTVSPTVTLDWIGFGVTVLSNNLAAAARLLDQVLHRPALAEEAIRAEQQILVQETSQVADDMYRYPFQLAFRAAYGDAGYGLPAHGLPEAIAALDPGAVGDWYQRTLLRTRGVVVAVGDLDPDAALPRLGEIFGGYAARDAEPLRAPMPWTVQAGSPPRLVERDKAQSAFALAFPGPSRRDPTRHAAEVWAAVASGLGGRLFEALRDRRSLAYTVMASSWQKARGGAFLSYIATSPEREAEARQEMLRELERFAAERVTADELERAVNYLAGQTEVSRQSAGAVAGEILDAWLAGGGLADLTDPAASYRAVTAEEVRQAAERTMRGPWGEGVVRGRGGGR
ncbi:MAG TPA: pitrilysin family protein [Gemmatimonadales bacterium]|nr:pitrilysin family protein [Gemmatimonadales bacterium]